MQQPSQAGMFLSAHQGPSSAGPPTPLRALAHLSSHHLPIPSPHRFPSAATSHARARRDRSLIPSLFLPSSPSPLFHLEPGEEPQRPIPSKPPATTEPLPTRPLTGPDMKQTHKFTRTSPDSIKVQNK